MAPKPAMPPGIAVGIVPGGTPPGMPVTPAIICIAATFIAAAMNGFGVCGHGGKMPGAPGIIGIGTGGTLAAIAAGGGPGGKPVYTVAWLKPHGSGVIPPAPFGERLLAPRPPPLGLLFAAFPPTLGDRPLSSPW
mmetsp:Transcript_20589/g.58215  ORF Transcript_20589/g.58215 Transcript_20589/m.58215 type:complete len:135 (+) Transcript_20589:778-1182(+)